MLLELSCFLLFVVNTNGCEFDKEQDMIMVPKHLSTNYLIPSTKIIALWWKNLVYTTLMKSLNITINSDKGTSLAPDIMHREEYSITSVISLQNNS